MEHSMYPEGGPDAAPCRAPAELRPRQQGTTESICGADFQDGNCRVHVEQQKLRDPLNNFGSTGQDRQLPDVDRHRVVGHYIFLRCARMRARFLIFSLLSLAAVTERPHGRKRANSRRTQLRDRRFRRKMIQPVLIAGDKF
jgi:hypothetical protein